MKSRQSKSLAGSEAECATPRNVAKLIDTTLMTKEMNYGTRLFIRSDLQIKEDFKNLHLHSKKNRRKILKEFDDLLEFQQWKEQNIVFYPEIPFEAEVESDFIWPKKTKKIAKSKRVQIPKIKISRSVPTREFPKWVKNAWNRIRDSLHTRGKISPLCDSNMIGQTGDYRFEFEDYIRTEFTRLCITDITPEEYLQHVKDVRGLSYITMVSWKDCSKDEPTLKMIDSFLYENYEWPKRKIENPNISLTTYLDNLKTIFEKFSDEEKARFVFCKKAVAQKIAKVKTEAIDIAKFVKDSVSDCFQQTSDHVEYAGRLLEKAGKALAGKATEGVASMCLYMQNMKTPTIDDIYAILETLKPMCAANLIGQMAVVKNADELFALTNCFCELYGLFWSDELLSFRQILTSLLSWILAGVLRYYWHKDSFEAQAGFETGNSKIVKEICDLFDIARPEELSDFSLKIFGAIVAIFVILTGGKFTKLGNLTTKKFFKNLKEFSSNVKSLSNLIDGLPKVWNFVMTEVASWFGLVYTTNESKAVENFKVDLMTFKQEIYELSRIMKESPQDLLMDSSRVRLAMASMERLDGLYDRMIRHKENLAATKGIFDDIKQDMKIIDDFVRAMNANTCQKVEPFVLMISGQAGIGKSQFISWFAKEFKKKFDEKFPEMESFQATCYPRTSTEAYWSGYNGQMFVTYDDFGQMKQDTDHADLMLVKNPNKTILPMADIPHKGTLFTSIGILGATNCVKPSSSALVKSMEAFLRRFEINIFASDPHFVQYKEQHGKAPGDTLKETGVAATRMEGGQEIPYFDADFGHLTLYRTFPDSDGRQQELITPHEIVDLAISYHTAYRTAYINSINPKITIAPEVTTNIHRPKESFADALARYEESMASSQASSIIDNVKQHKVIKQKVEDAIFEPAELEFMYPVEEMIFRPSRNRRDLPLAEGNFKGQTAKAASTAFEFVGLQKGKVFMIFGDPGTGKSFLMNQVCQFSGMKKIHASDFVNVAIDSPALYIEDISVSAAAFEKVRLLIMKIRDGQSPIQKLFVTLNPEMAKSYFGTLEEAAAFFRRGFRYRFTWSIKKRGFFKHEYHTPEDLELHGLPHSKCVDIELCNYYDPVKKVRKYILFDDLSNVLVDEAKDLNYEQFVKVATISVPWIAPDQFIPDFVLQVKETLYDFFKVCYQDPKQIGVWYVTGKVKMLKGSYGNGYSIAKQFTGCTTSHQPEFPPDLDKFIVMINNAEFSSEKKFVTEIRGSDCSVLIMPQLHVPKNIRCFRIDPLLKYTEGIFSDEEGTFACNDATKRTYDDFKEVARQVGERLPYVVDTIEDESNKTVGLESIKDTAPLLFNTIRIAIFLFKLGLAGGTIYQVLKMAKDRFAPYSFNFEKRSKKKKSARVHKKVLLARIKERTKGKFTKDFYNAMVQWIKEHGSTAAKDKGILELMSDFLDIHGDEQSLDSDAFGDWCMHYSVEDDWSGSDFEDDLDDFDFESGTDLSKAVPQIVPGPMLIIEKDKPEEKKVPKMPSMEESIVRETQEKTTNVARKPLTSYYAQAVADKGCVDIARHAIMNTVDLGYIEDGTFVRECAGLMVAQKVGATVAHLYDPNKTLYAKALRAPKELFPVTILNRKESLDLMIFKIEAKQLPMFRDLRRHMLKTIDDFKKNFHGRQGILVTGNLHKENIETFFRNVKIEERMRVKTTFSDCTKVIEGITYSGILGDTYKAGIDYSDLPIMTQAGDCGSVLIVNDSSIQEKLLGVHNAANYTRGSATMLFSTYFDKYIDSAMRPETASSLKCTAPLKHNIPYKTVSNSTCLGMPVIAEINEPPSVPTKSKFWDSPLALGGDNPFQPSVLSAYDPRNLTEKHPLYNSLSKWNHEQPKLNKQKLAEIGEDIGFWYADAINAIKHRTKVLTKTEAVNNNQFYEFKGLSRDSSPGYPWKKMAPKVAHFLTVKNTPQGAYYSIDEKNTIGRKLSQSIDNLIEICKTGTHYPHIPFAGSCKDEPIKLSKVYDVNTRTFAGAPLDYTILGRMYFSSLRGAVQKVRFNRPVQIGINPTSLDWDAMIKDMLKTSDVGTDCDFANWDGTVPGELKVAGLPEVWNTIARETDPDWKEEDDIIRRAILKAEEKPRLVIPLSGSQVIVQAKGGQPSGSSGTAPDNSFAQLILLRNCWDDIVVNAGFPHLACMSMFLSFVCPKIYGDDGNIAIHPDALSFFNFTSISSWFKSIGMKCTPAAKNGKIIDYMSIFDFEFLKRNTVEIYGKYYGALQKKVFHKTLGYCKGPPHNYWNETRQVPIKTTDLCQTASAACLEALLHGKEYYNEIRDHCLNRLACVGITEEIPRYNDAVVANSFALPRC